MRPTGMPATTVLDIAVRRGGVSYTADVMDALRAEHPDLDLAVLIGADAARTINQWHRAADLLSAERFVIVNRTGSTATQRRMRWPGSATPTSGPRC